MKSDQDNERFGRRKLRASYVTSIISIMLVLYMLGLLGLIILHARKLSEYVKENISIAVMMKDNAPEAKVLQLKKNLELSGTVKNVHYVTREEAAKTLSQDIGEDFVGFIGYNPLPASLDVQLKASYANTDSITKFERKLSAYPIVREVVYQKSMIDVVNDNIRKLSMVILGFSLILLVIAAALINNTIRLSVYARRFLIRSMLLVGATETFIRKPFILKSLLHGLIAGLLASVLLFLSLLVAQDKIPELLQFQDNRMVSVLIVLVIVLGLIISLVSTWFAVSKFLRMKVDGLYTS
jgi:cell division transport system permease protein